MFSEKLEIDDLVEAAVWGAEERGRKDRERFRPLLLALERVARERGMVFGGEAAQHMALRDGGEPVPLGLYQGLVLYSSRPVRDAKELAQAFYDADPEGAGQYAGAVPRAGLGGKSRESGGEMKVDAGQRPLALVRGLPHHRGVHVFEVITPDTRRPLFGTEPVLSVGVETLLLEVCARLCSPAEAGDWEELRGRERALRELFLRELPEKMEAATGGKEAPAAGAARRRKSFLDLLRRRFLGRAGRLDVYGDGNISSRPACVSALGLEHEKKTLFDLADEGGVSVHILVNDPQLLPDRRLRRLTVYLQIPGKGREPVLDVYNLAEYEAVPFLLSPAPGAGGAVGRRGTAYLAARFLLVEIWTLQLIWRMGAVGGEYARRQVEGLVRRYEQLARDRLGDPAELHPRLPEHHLGRVENAALAAKRRARAERQAGGRARRPAPFFPARFQKEAEGPDAPSGKDQA